MEKNGWKKVLAGIWKVVSFPSIATIVIVALLVGLFQLSQLIIGPSRVSEEIKEEFRAGSDKLPRVEVCFDFKPEDFHIKTMQKFASLGGVTDHGVYLMYVKEEAVRTISHIYWVEEIKFPE